MRGGRERLSGERTKRGEIERERKIERERERERKSMTTQEYDQCLADAPARVGFSCGGAVQAGERGEGLLRYRNLRFMSNCVMDINLFPYYPFR